MRISDWSSDVCSSDLPQGKDGAEAKLAQAEILAGRQQVVIETAQVVGRDPELVTEVAGEVDPPDPGRHHAEIHAAKVHERKARVGDIFIGEPRQQLARLRPGNDRSEEHTSELQSLMRISYAVFC